MGGFNGGRARQLVDMIASKGFMVVMPDYFRGGFCEPTKPEFNEFLKRVTVASNITKDFDAAMKYAKEHGAQTFSCIGTCWGSYANLRISGHMKSLKCAVSLHPAHHGMIEALGEDENAILEEAKGVPQMFLPAGNDPPETKEGGLARKILSEGESCLKIVEFHDMVHGWTVRGDMSVPEVDRDKVRARSHYRLRQDKYECLVKVEIIPKLIFQ